MKILLLLITLVSFSLQADEYLIQEMEDLNNSLSSDDPARSELVLRLADLYFDTSIQESSDNGIVEKRRRSLELYEKAYLGLDGIKKITGSKLIKVEYQMARLYMKLSNEVKAITLFKNVYESTSDKDLKREASFELAQWYEKQAEFSQTQKYYLSAIELCNTVDTCNYAHYRMSWVLYKETKLDEAINEIQLSLWDSKGQIREKVLNDYIMFLSSKNTDGKNELIQIEKLSKKIDRISIIRILAESYFSNGNREAGIHFFEYLNRKNPNIYFEVRLLEEYYGNSDWKNINKYISKINNRTKEESFNKEEIVTIFQRVIVQLDAEIQQDPKHKMSLINAIDIYLNLFPNDKLRQKMQEGWLKVEENKPKKIAKLNLWIKEANKFNQDKETVLNFRLTRLSLAQEIKKSEIIIEEALEIAKVKVDEEKRKYTYIAARQMYEDKKLNEALILFLEISNFAIENSISDKWSVLSQNLVLDIYNTQKKYTALMQQSQKWLNVENFKKDKALTKELDHMYEIYRQAKFQNAVSLGESIEALDTFYNYCINKIYAEKSCPNAKVLAIKLKEQSKLIGLLESANDEKALLVEYELMGKFDKAAILFEKFNVKSNDIKTLLKLALLYELSTDFKNRDRVLIKMINVIKKSQKIEPDLEKLVFITLDEANLLGENVLNVNWSLPLKIKLANRLQMQKPTKVTSDILLSQKQSVGPQWSKLVLSKIIPFDKKQKKISFYGRNSKVQFNKRVKALDLLANNIKTYLEGADLETRIYLLHIALNAYENFSKEINNTPLPDGLDEQTLSNVKEQLAQMAGPFVQISNDYKRLMEEQILQINNEQDKIRVSANLQIENPDYSSFFKEEAISRVDVANFNYISILKSKEILQSDPSSKVALENLSDFYKINKSIRIASYFQERIDGLSGMESK